jgi:CheY-like chemotaxis protein
MSIKRIYTVDDYPLAAYVVKRTIESISKHHCIVSDFESPAVLLYRFKQEFEKVDMVITDYEMPDIRGNELIKKLREIKPTIQIVVVSAWLDDTTGEDRHLIEKEVKALKPDLILSKPFPPKWVESIDTLLEKQPCTDC